MLDIERRTGVKDADITSFLKKVGDVESLVKGMKDGSIDPDDKRIRKKLGIKSDEERRAEEQATAKRREAARLRREAEAKAEKEEEHRKWWDAAEMMFGEAKKHAEESDAERAIRAATNVNRIVGCYTKRDANDYSQWHDWKPKDPVTLEEEAEQQAMLDKLRDAEFEKNNPDFCNQFKKDLEDRQKSSEEKRRKAEKQKKLGNQYFKRKEYTAALKHYMTALQDERFVVTYLTNIAQTHLRLEQWDDCLEFCKRAIYVEPKCIKAYSRRAAVYRLQGRLAEAVAELKKAVEIDEKECSRADNNSGRVINEDLRREYAQVLALQKEGVLEIKAHARMEKASRSAAAPLFGSTKSSTNPPKVRGSTRSTGLQLGIDTLEAAPVDSPKEQNENVRKGNSPQGQAQGGGGQQSEKQEHEGGDGEIPLPKMKKTVEAKASKAKASKASIDYSRFDAIGDDEDDAEDEKLRMGMAGLNALTQEGSTPPSLSLSPGGVQQGALEALKDVLCKKDGWADAELVLLGRVIKNLAHDDQHTVGCTLPAPPTPSSSSSSSSSFRTVQIEASHDDDDSDADEDGNDIMDEPNCKPDDADADGALPAPAPVMLCTLLQGATSRVDQARRSGSRSSSSDPKADQSELQVAEDHLKTMQVLLRTKGALELLIRRLRWGGALCALRAMLDPSPSDATGCTPEVVCGMIDPHLHATLRCITLAIRGNPMNRETVFAPPKNAGAAGGGEGAAELLLEMLMMMSSAHAADAQVVELFLATEEGFLKRTQRDGTSSSTASSMGMANMAAKTGDGNDEAEEGSVVVALVALLEEAVESAEGIDAPSSASPVLRMLYRKPPAVATLVSMLQLITKPPSSSRSGGSARRLGGGTMRALGNLLGELSKHPEGIDAIAKMPPPKKVQIIDPAHKEKPPKSTAAHPLPLRRLLDQIGSTLARCTVPAPRGCEGFVVGRQSLMAALVNLSTRKEPRSMMAELDLKGGGSGFSSLVELLLSVASGDTSKRGDGDTSGCRALALACLMNMATEDSGATREQILCAFTSTQGKGHSGQSRPRRGVAVIPMVMALLQTKQKPETAKAIRGLSIASHVHRFHGAFSVVRAAGLLARLATEGGAAGTRTRETVAVVRATLQDNSEYTSMLVRALGCTHVDMAVPMVAAEKAQVDAHLVRVIACVIDRRDGGGACKAVIDALNEGNEGRGLHRLIAMLPAPMLGDSSFVQAGDKAKAKQVETAKRRIREQANTIGNAIKCLISCIGHAAMASNDQMSSMLLRAKSRLVERLITVLRDSDDGPVRKNAAICLAKLTRVPAAMEDIRKHRGMEMLRELGNRLLR